MSHSVYVDIRAMMFLRYGSNAKTARGICLNISMGGHEALSLICLLHKKVRMTRKFRLKQDAEKG